MENEIFDVAIVGAGCAGLAAAMYCGRFELKTICFDPMPGGTISLTHIVENYPPIKSISGLELAEKFLEHAKAYNINLNYEKVKKIEKKDNLFLISAETSVYKALSIIFATGSEWKKLNAPGEEKFLNKGVHFCASCDGPLYKGKKIAVVGSGDSAAKESLLLAEYGEIVYILVRGDRLKGEPINNKKVFENKKIKVFTNIEVKEFLGEKKLEKIKLSRSISINQNQPTDLLDIDAVFVFIGHIPQSQIAKDLGVNLNQKGEIITNKLCQTNINGFFAAGDCTDIEFKQAVVSAAQGVLAAYSAKEYIQKIK
jgi:thioredoxin reductase (NADPH)